MNREDCKEQKYGIEMMPIHFDTEKAQRMNVAACGAFFLFSLFIFYTYWGHAGKKSERITLIMVFVLVVYVLWCEFSHNGARYIVTEDGINAKYPFRKSRLYPWNSFHTVCICFSGANNTNPLYDQCFCFVRKGAVRNIFTGTWEDFSWEYKRVIMTKFDLSDYLSLVEICPIEIIDLRTNNMRRLF